jgi:hypothetical protein
MKNVFGVLGIIAVAVGGAVMFYNVAMEALDVIDVATMHHNNMPWYITQAVGFVISFPFMKDEYKRL